MADHSDNDANPESKKRKRSRTGCLNCRRRRKLCDERKPGCVRCERMGEECTWPAAFSFRESGWQGKFESTINVAETVAAAPNLEIKRSTSTMTDGNVPHDDVPDFFPTNISALERTKSVTSAAGDRQVATPSTSVSAIPGSISSLLQSPLESPDAFVGYYPNAEYRHLHATLYDAMVDTARDSTDATRQGTPDPSHTPLQGLKLDQIPHKPSPIRPNVDYVLPDGITFARERELWCSYLGEISPWLDMFDNQDHFRIHIPVMARSSSALRLSVLALASRQLERLDSNKPCRESLALYQEAIHLITQELRFMQTPLIASCVLLCVLEMMSSSPRDWARHLEGCASLIKAAGIDGTVGGIEQAIFWCFARMDMWGSFLTDTSLRIPTSLWFFPVEPIAATLDRLKLSSSSFDQYANLSVFLCASTLNLLSRDKTSTDEPYSKQWHAMFDLLETWHSDRPSEMLPILYCSESKGNGSFPLVLFTNPSAISGNQLYHAAALLMLQSKPADVKLKSHKSLFWHARHIIGITASNPNQ